MKKGHSEISLINLGARLGSRRPWTTPRGNKDTKRGSSPLSRPTFVTGTVRVQTLAELFSYLQVQINNSKPNETLLIAEFNTTSASVQLYLNVNVLSQNIITLVALNLKPTNLTSVYTVDLFLLLPNKLTYSRLKCVAWSNSGVAPFLDRWIIRIISGQELGATIKRLIINPHYMYTEKWLSSIF